MRHRSLLGTALQEMDAGRVSAEEAVRAALSGSSALQRLLKRTEGRWKQRPAIRRGVQLPAGVIAAAIGALERRLKRHSHVTSVHWGARQLRGRPTGETAIVVHVTRKLRLASLKARRLVPIPRHVIIRRRNRRYKVTVDVQTVRSPARLHVAFIHPGDHGTIRTNGAVIGSLGAIADGPGGRFAITAGHVASLVADGENAECVDDEAGSFALGPLRCSRFADGIDVGLIGPIPFVPANAAQDATVARNPTETDVLRRVQLILPGLFTPLETHIDGVNATRGFVTAVGIITMSGLTTTARVTEPGDSGSPAVDENGVVIGFVIGGDSNHTYLLPARRALDAIQDSL